MTTRNLVGSLASALLLALLFVPGGAGSTGASATAMDECQPIIDGSCMHCHQDGVCLSCLVYVDLGVGGVGHLLNHCLHG